MGISDSRMVIYLYFEVGYPSVKSGNHDSGIVLNDLIIK